MVNFAEAYQLLSDDEILRLAADRENLLEEARQVLDGELRRRGLTASSIAEYQGDVEQADMRQQLGNLRSFFLMGSASDSSEKERVSPIQAQNGRSSIRHCGWLFSGYLWFQSQLIGSVDRCARHCFPILWRPINSPP